MTPVTSDAAPLSNLSSGRVNINTSHKYQTPRQNETTPKPITAAIIIETASETLGPLDIEFVTSLFDVLTTLTLSFSYKKSCPCHVDRTYTTHNRRYRHRRGLRLMSLSRKCDH
jgi:hypothetical protein